MTRPILRLLIGGSPCTHWSIAQKNNRETTASGIGWELFKNYLYAKEKFAPDHFLYENNKSAAAAIKEQIAEELHVYHYDMFNILTSDNGVRFTEINSALLSAQNRERFYVTSFGNISAPEDKKIYLHSVIDGFAPFERDLTASEAQNAPVRIGGFSGGQAQRIYSIDGKSVTINAGGGGQGGKTGLYAVPVCVAQRGRYTETGKVEQNFEARLDGKTNTITTVTKDNLVAVPICLRYERTEEAKELRKDYESGKIKVRRCDLREWQPRPDGKTNTLTTVLKDNPIVEIASTVPGSAMGKTYEVKNGQIEYMGKKQPIRLPDGFYIIRNLSVNECRRLQTIPDWYVMPCSNSQNYKMLGNGWTVAVIKHLLSHIPHLLDYDIEVLSLYDGMSCGQIALKEMGARVVKYVSYEIDKYCIETTQANFPNTIQCGDAFQIRADDWRY